MPPPVSATAIYNLLARTHDEWAPTLQSFGMGLSAVRALAQGMLGHHLGVRVATESALAGYDSSRAAADLGEIRTNLESIARDHGMAMAQLAAAWVTSRPFVDVAYIGARTPRQLRELAEACLKPLPPDVLAAVDGIVPPGTDRFTAAVATLTPRALTETVAPSGP